MKKILRKIFSKKNCAVQSSHPPINSVIPLIKSKSWIDSYQFRIQAALENENHHLSILNEFGVVNQLFLPALYLVYAYDFSDSLAYLSLQDLKKLGFNLNSVHKLAIANTLNISCEVKQISDEVFLLQTDDISLTTAMIFRDALWDKVSNLINDDPIISISSCEAILIAKSSSQSAIEELKQFANGFASVDEAPLSTELFIRSDQKWVPAT